MSVLKELGEGLLVAGWRVFWVPAGAGPGGVRPSLVEGWEDLAGAEKLAGISPGDPILLAPDYRVDELLCLYLRTRRFRRYTAETKRNYATDICLFLNFLWTRGHVWTQAVAEDVDDYEDWRRFAPDNANRVSGAKWDRELTALAGLYAWAEGRELIPQNPVAMKEILGRDGTVIRVPAGKAKDAKRSDVRWLTPRAWRRWVDVGMRGHSVGGLPDPAWAGRLEDRNSAFANLLYSSGMRLSEGGSLLTFEVPSIRLRGGRYYVGRIAAAVTRSKKSRTFYVAVHVLGEVEAYQQGLRAEAVRKAQATGRYDAVVDMRLVTQVTTGTKRQVHWCDRNGVVGRKAMADLTVAERMTLYTEGPQGPEPLWLWLNEQGLPFRVSSWENVFRTANERCRTALDPGPGTPGLDPYRSIAPQATPHSARHSFALYMLVVLHYLMDRKFGLTPEERRDFRLLYGDPWRMVQDLLGHADLETTRAIYLAPVADLQLRSLLESAPLPGHDEAESERSLDELFARVARETEGIQDIDARMEVKKKGPTK
ncbi:site-specific integrase [Streptomyces sp. NBC_00160]|uniref:tyrosine-type recombinase/integrase n=1 Tax=Streptomyces sp. NBC_00160 TaxID=2903628 RepID=UPI0022577C02|nr:site-specific integrase [Streptomyces sp. NBC_00160]MCX5309012.1 site-specific integrase [Streptomyces sp. NBC_00160]